MTRSLAAVLLLLVPVFAVAQNLSSSEVNTARWSASSFFDTGSNRPVAGFNLDVRQAIPNQGVLSTWMGFVQNGASVRLARQLLQWDSILRDNRQTSAAAGTFFYQPQLFDNRAGNIFMPSVLIRGVQTDWKRGRTTFESFAGRAVVEEGSRIMYDRTTSDTLLGATASFELSKTLNIAFQAARTSANPADSSIVRANPVPAVSLQARQAAQWRPSSWVTVDGEYALSRAAGAVSASYNGSLAHDGSTFSFRAAYVRRSLNYMPFGTLSFSAGRQGPLGELRYQPARWLEFSGSAGTLHTNPERVNAVPASESRQLTAGATVRLPKNVQVMLSHSQSGLNLRSESSTTQHFIAINSVTVTHAFQRWISRVRMDEISLHSNVFNRTRGIEVDVTRIFQNGLSLSGQSRIQRTEDVSRPVTRVSTSIRGGYNFGNRVSLNIQTDFGRDIRNESLFATSNLRTSTASLTVKLPRSSELRFEYYGTRLNYDLNPQSVLASTLLGNSVAPMIAGANRNLFYIQFQKTIRWGKGASAMYSSTTAGTTIIRPLGTVAGRVFVDANEDGNLSEDEAGLGGATVWLNQTRKVTTDETGRFEFTAVPVGPNEIALETNTLDARFTPTETHQPVTVTFKTRTEKNFALLAASTISGRIVERKGDLLVPVADAALRLEPGGLYAYSDASGDFSISNVPRGQYQLALVTETVDHPVKVIKAPAGSISIDQAGQRLENVEFVVEADEVAPVIERLPPARIIVTSSSNR